MSQWSGWTDFLAMGGYGLYVWGSFAMCALVLVTEVGLLALRRRAAREDDNAVVDGRRAGT